MGKGSLEDVDDFLVAINQEMGFEQRKTLLLVENHSITNGALERLFGSRPRIKNTGVVTYYEHQGIRLKYNYIGLQPLEINDERWLVLIVPKGVLQHHRVGLKSADILRHVYEAFHRFFQMRFSISSQVSVKQLDRASLQAVQNPSRILVLLLAQSYKEVLTRLCRRDFRRFYQHREATFHGAWRGRVVLERYVQNYAAGRPHMVPCSFETFTADNLSNQILRCALNHLLHLARQEQLGSFLLQMLAPLLEQFSGVRDIEPRNIPYHRAQLRHVSALYARALDMAEVIIGEHGDYSTGINQSLYQSSEKEGESVHFPFLYNTYDCFEKFVEQISTSCASGISSGTVTSQRQLPIRGLFAKQFSVQLRHPKKESRQFIDFALMCDGNVLCLGDAKYADCVDWNDDVVLLNKRFQISYLRQLYTYMRWKNCDRGLFVVPVWWSDSRLARARQWEDGGWRSGAAGWLRFASEQATPAFDVYYSTSPLDRVDPRGDENHRVRFLGINMMKPPGSCQESAARLIQKWISSPEHGQ